MTSRLLAALCAVSLLVPAIAVAQSAGDEQYTDPFAGNAPAGHSPTSSAPSQNTSSPSVQSPGQLASSSSPGGTASGDPGTSSGGSGNSLPRTGFDAWMLAVMGALMLLAGVLLRLGLRPLPWRAASGSPATLGRDVRLIRRASR